MRIPLHVHAPRAILNQPVSLGVPLPRGMCNEAQPLILLGDAGASIPLQTNVLARWPGGSVRWLLLDFLIATLPAGKHVWTLQPADISSTSNTLSVVREGKGVTIRTGASVLYLGHEFATLLEHVICDGFQWCDVPLLIQLMGERAPIEVSQAGDWHAEATGPVRATVHRRTLFDRNRLCANLRLDSFAGTALMRVQLTVCNLHAAHHPGGLWDLDDPGTVNLRALEIVLRSPEPNLAFRCSRHADGEEFLTRDSLETIAAASSPAEHRFSPLVRIESTQGAVTVAVPEFWQQGPRSLSWRDWMFRIGLWSEHEPKTQLQGGEQKTHTAWFHFAPPNPNAPLPLEWVHDPAIVTVDPAWLRSSGVLPHLPDHDPACQLDQHIAAIVQGPHNWFAKRDTGNEYGWRNYGEVYADHENAHYDGPRPIVSHYNNQYDVILGLLLQYWRTGDIRYWQLADPLARHVIDIDLYHSDQDKAAYNGGMFWHTDHYKDAATATHRAYSRKNAVPGKPYGGGPSNEHNYTTGLLHYYYLTGDPQARDAVLSLANWVLRMDDGRRNILRLLDDGPTGLASQTRSPDYHGPGRGAGNSINTLLDAWLLTGERHYLEYAETLIRRCIHPRDDVASRDLLDLENRWSYTVFLSVLDRYLTLKSETGEQDKMYAYARQSLLHYAEWMLDHELPYFDQTEKLEYPTETWAAQDLRKGNVLRLAARYAEEPLRGRMLQRGTEFADRAWRDLLLFDSRFTTRPLALIMREGTVDLALRPREVTSMPAPKESFDFRAPESFVPQKQRVKQMLCSPLGWLQALGRLLDPRRWRR